VPLKGIKLNFKILSYSQKTKQKIFCFEKKTNNFQKARDFFCGIFYTILYFLTLLCSCIIITSIIKNVFSKIPLISHSTSKTHHFFVTSETYKNPAKLSTNATKNAPNRELLSRVQNFLAQGAKIRFFENHTTFWGQNREQNVNESKRTCETLPRIVEH
jgi:hypothetical protein